MSIVTKDEVEKLCDLSDPKKIELLLKSAGIKIGRRIVPVVGKYIVLEQQTYYYGSTVLPGKYRIQEVQADGSFMCKVKIKERGCVISDLFYFKPEDFLE